MCSSDLDRKKAYIESDIGYHDSEIAPMLVIKDIDAVRKKLVARFDAAKLAGRGCLGVGKIAASRRDKSFHVSCTCQTSRWVQSDELDWRTVDFLAADKLPEDTSNEVGIGGEVVPSTLNE